MLPDAIYLFGIILIDSSSLTVARAGRAARAGYRSHAIMANMSSARSGSPFEIN